MPKMSRYLFPGVTLLWLAGALVSQAVSAALPAGGNGGRMAAAPAVPLDRVIVIVNDDVITESELKHRLAAARRQLRRENIAVPPEDVLTRQLLERMTIERLQLQTAQRRGISVTPAEVERALARIAARARLTPQRYLAGLKTEGLDPAEFREELREQLVIQRLVEREINNRVSVSDAEIDYVMRQLAAGGQADQEFRLAHIFIAVPEAASPQAIRQARETAEQARREIAAGEAFERVAAAYSQAEDALRGGALGWRKAGQLPDLYLEALRRLEPGGVSEVLRGPNGFHLIRLIERRGGMAEKRVTQTHVRHILLKPSEIQSLAEAKAKLRLLRERVTHGEDFGALARAHSEDDLSAAAGGDLGWVNPGQLVPEFEQAMNELAPGTLSQPVETPFGVHLIEVLARREQDVSDQYNLAQARQLIHARKAEEMYQEWVRRLRDEAYVEYLTEAN